MGEKWVTFSLGSMIGGGRRPPTALRARGLFAYSGFFASRRCVGYLSQVVRLRRRLTSLWVLQSAALLLLVGWLYYPILSPMVRQWWDDPNFSHGFFVPLFSGLAIWQNRARLAAVPRAPSLWGVPILVAGLCARMWGVTEQQLFLSRASLLLVIAALVILFLGWAVFRAVLFPWTFLIMMIPIPRHLFAQITSPLQGLASWVAATVLPLAGVPVLRQGNIINLPAMPLEVAEACSGIRSLLSLTTLAVFYGYLNETRLWVRLVLAAAAVPIAVLANSLRIVGTGLTVQYWDPAKAEGFFHLFSGWLVFVASLAMLFLLHWWLRPRRRSLEPVEGISPV
jgi:exosortase